MSSLYLLFVVGVFVVGSQALPTNNKLQVDIYYESQCPACQRFFHNQLRPVNRKLHNYLDINLIPYGKARTIKNGDQITFECQHGATECTLNLIHACALKRLGIDDLKRVELVGCLEDLSDEPMNAGKVCSEKFGLEWEDVLSCSQGREGALLSEGYGNQTTKTFSPRIHLVPTTVIDKVIGDEDFRVEVFFHLQKVLCDRLAKKNQHPQECN